MNAALLLRQERSISILLAIAANFSEPRGDMRNQRWKWPT